MWAIFKKEISLFFSSLIGYIIIGVFLLIIGLFVWVLPNFSVLDGSYAQLDVMFEVAPFVFLFLIPAITMRSFAEERKTGTIEILSTKPLTETQLVMGKYLAGLVLVLLSILPTVLYYFSLRSIAYPVGNVDSGAFWGSFMGLMLVAATYLALGICASSLTDNQIVAFILGLGMCLFFYFILDQMVLVSWLKNVKGSMKALSIREHYLSISRGVLDTRDLVYFISFTAVFIYGTITLVRSRKWY